MTADEYLDSQIGPAATEPQATAPNTVMTADQYIDSQIKSPTPEAFVATAPEEKPSGLAAGFTALEAIPSGISNSVADTALGATQAIAQGLNKVGVLPDTLNVGGTDYGYKAGSEGINEIKAMKDAEIAEALKGNVPAQIAEGASNLAGNVGQYAALPGEGAVAALAKGLGLGASQPVQDGQTTVLGVPVDNRVLNSGVSGAAALVGQKLGDALSTEVKDPNLANNMQTAADSDIPVYRNQTSDSRFMKAMAGVLKNIPGGGGGAAAEEQVGAFNKAVNATIGQPDEPITSSTVLGKAAQDIGKVYDSVKQYPLVDSSDFQTKLAALRADAQVNTVGDQRDMVNQQIDALQKNLTQNGGASPASGKVTTLYHGTNTPFDKYDFSKSGGIGYFGETPEVAEGYATGSGGQRARLPDTEKYFVNDEGGNAAVVRSLGSDGLWHPVGKTDSVGGIVNLQPLSPSDNYKSFTMDEAKHAISDAGGTGAAVGKSARVKPQDFSGLNTLDLTDPANLKVITALQPTTQIGSIIQNAAKTSIKAGDTAQFSRDFWGQTKFSNGIADQLNKDIIGPLKQQGYDSIRFNDDGHPTIGVFDNAKTTSGTNLAGTPLPAAPGSGSMSGEAAKQTISNLGQVARGANSSPQLRQLRSLVNQQWASTMAPEDAQALQTADQQWKNLVALDGPVSRNPNGPISPTAVQAGVKNVSSDYSRDGGGQLGSLSRLGQLMGKNFPDSGTAANEKIMDMLKHVGTAVAVGGGGAYIADSDKQSAPVRALQDLGGAGAAILAARYGISPYVFSKMSLSPSTFNSAAPGALAGLTNYFQSQPAATR